jgi:hypothetical protein
MSFEIPILFLIFNRPETTQRVFEEIKKQKPKFLFVAADGARRHIEDDIIKCKKARDIVLDGIDWDCELKTLFRDENLGCGKAVQSALDWFFDEVEMGVIIEDDIIPSSSFFEYSSLLLKTFQDNHQIFSINGCNLAYENYRSDYGLTRYFNMWGWATWKRSNDLVRRSWSTYNSENDFTRGSAVLKSLHLDTIWPQDEWIYNWQRIFKDTKRGTIDTWDYQWVYTCIKNESFCIRPNLNLVNNIGFNENGTHTIQTPHFKLSNMRVHEMQIKEKGLRGKMYIDPKYEIRNVAGYWHSISFNFSDLLNKVLKKIKKMYPNF